MCLDREYKMQIYERIIDRVREFLAEFFQTDIEGEEYGSQILFEYTTIALAAAEQILNLKLAGKIVRFGMEKGIRTNDFIILRVYFTGAIKD